MGDGIETGKKTERRKISQRKIPQDNEKLQPILTDSVNIAPDFPKIPSYLVKRSSHTFPIKRNVLTITLFNAIAVI